MKNNLNDLCASLQKVIVDILREKILNARDKTKIKNIASGIEKNCDILRKNDNILEVILEGTTIKILLKKKTNKYIGYFKEMEFESDG